MFTRKNSVGILNDEDPKSIVKTKKNKMASIWVKCAFLCEVRVGIISS